MSNPTNREILDATAKVRRGLMECERAALRGRMIEAFAAAEKAEQDAFHLKVMFALPAVDKIQSPTPEEDTPTDE